MMTKHMVQRSLSFIALTGMLACTGDPTGDFANGVDHLEATPTTFYVASGSSTLIRVTARDASNNPVSANFSVADVGPGITVERDLAFEPIRNSDGDLVPNPNPSRVQYIVTATAPAAFTNFTIAAGGEEVEVTTVVTPLSGGAFTVLNPTLNDILTVNAADGLIFTDESGVDFGGVTGEVISVAGDGSSMQVKAIGSYAGYPTLTAIQIEGLAAPIDVVSDDSITIAGGADDPADGASITLPANVGDSVIVQNIWTVDNLFWTINPTAGSKTYEITLDWDGDADMDLLRCLSTDPACGAGAYWAGTAAKPEVTTRALGVDAGTTGAMRLWVQFYDHTHPTYVTIKIKRTI